MFCVSCIPTTPQLLLSACGALVKVRLFIVCRWCVCVCVRLHAVGRLVRKFYQFYLKGWLYGDFGWVTSRNGVKMWDSLCVCVYLRNTVLFCFVSILLYKNRLGSCLLFLLFFFFFFFFFFFYMYLWHSGRFFGKTNFFYR